MTVKDDTRELERRSNVTTPGVWDELDRWFSDFGRQGWPGPFTRDWLNMPQLRTVTGGGLPRVDVVDRDTALVVRAELPGVRKDDVEVTVEEFSVTLKASTRQEHKEEEGAYYRREMTRGEYQRTLSLPCAVDEEKAQATFTDGVLELTLPKQEKTRRRSVRVE